MENRYRFIIFFILGFFMTTTIGCVGAQPTPEKSIPQSCRGQETHTCNMPGMTDKPLPAKR